jgi:hypothetical protein
MINPTHARPSRHNQNTGFNLALVRSVYRPGEPPN